LVKSAFFIIFVVRAIQLNPPIQFGNSQGWIQGGAKGAEAPLPFTVGVYLAMC